MLTQYSKHSYHSGDFDAWKPFPKAAREQGCAEPRGTAAADPCWLRAGQAAPGPEELGGSVLLRLIRQTAPRDGRGFTLGERIKQRDCSTK